MADSNLHLRLINAVDNYYVYNPDTLTPLLILALAVHGHLAVTHHPQKEQNIFALLDLSKALHYDWVKYDPTLKKRIRQLMANNVDYLSVVGEIDEEVRDIYNIFHHYDTYTVDEEYHHRIGLLYDHSSNLASDRAHREYATICLVEALLAVPSEALRADVLELGHYMLVKSGLQPERPRLEVAHAFRLLLQYDGEGNIYNPFAGCGVAAAALEGGNHLWADGNSNAKLFAAARVLNYAMGGSNAHFEQHNSTLWRPGKFDYIVNTYMGYIGGRTAFDFCLSKCFDSLSEKGRFVGMISPKDIFEKQSPEMKEAFRRDWVDTIVLFSFGEVAVLINANKDPRMKKRVRFCNLNIPSFFRRSLTKMLADDSKTEIFPLSEARKIGFFQRLLAPKLPERKDWELVRLGDFVQKKRRQTYALTRVPQHQRILASINRSKPYSRFDADSSRFFEKSPITSLFAPAYLLDGDCLVTNRQGDLEPRPYLMHMESSSAYFQDGYAFSVKHAEDCTWLMEELNQSYVVRQLHPYGENKMVPESFTEDQVLNLRLYRKRPSEEPLYGAMGDQSYDGEQSRLPVGQVIVANNVEYTIQKFLGHGSFGYTYRAAAYHRATGEEENVVLKEYYPYQYCRREGIKAVLKDEGCAEIVRVNRSQFLKEASIMQELGNISDSHIVPVYDRFYNEESDTDFYVMPLYKMSLEDCARQGDRFSEEMCIHQILKPICKALYIAHGKGVLHLDIKPDNIMIDPNNVAALIDFGVARYYDQEGHVLNADANRSQSGFAAPELRIGNMARFGPQPDIYGLAATVYYLVTGGKRPRPIADFSDHDKFLSAQLKKEKCSDQFIRAIISAMQVSVSGRPKDALAFLRLFPGCEHTQY